MFALLGTPEEYLDGLKQHIECLQDRVERLSKENEKLRSEAYKDLELAKMKEERDRALEEMYNGFPISNEEKKAIEDWKEKHDAEKHNAKTLKQRLCLEGVSGGRYKYIFVPTAIGTVGKIQCSCGETFEFCGI